MGRGSRCADWHPVRALHRDCLGAAAVRGGEMFQDNLLAPAARLAGCRPVGSDPSPNAGAAEPCRGDRLAACFGGFLVRCRQKGSDAVGPNPTDRGKPGTECYIVVDRKGLPLAIVLTGANCHDSMALTEVVDAIHPIRQRRGRPASGRRSSMPTRAAISTVAGRTCASAPSRRASLAAASTAHPPTREAFQIMTIQTWKPFLLGR